MKKKVIIFICAFVLIAGAITVIIVSKNTPVDLTAQLFNGNSEYKSLKEATLTFIIPGQNELSEIEKSVLEEVEKKAANIKIKLDIKTVPKESQYYLDEVKRIISSGEPCDAFYFSQNFLNEGLKELVAKGIAKDITDLFYTCAPNYSKQYTSQEILAASLDGKLYAVPNRSLSSQMCCALVRDDLMAKYKIPDINNYSDYEVYLKAIKENEPKIVPMGFYDSTIGLLAEANGYVIFDYEKDLVYKWDDPACKIMAWEQTPEYKECFDTLIDWYKKGYFMKELGPAEITDHMVTSGKWGSFITAIDNELYFNSMLKAKNVSYRYKAYPLNPKGTGERISPMVSTLIISSKSENAERVLMFLEWLQEKQSNYDALMYGIKGKTYSLDEKKLKEETAAGGSYHDFAWRCMFRNYDFERVESSYATNDVEKHNELIKTKTRYPAHMGFIPDYTAVNDISALRMSGFFKNEYAVFTGLSKTIDIDKYISDQKENGINNLIGEAQRQFDKWRADNKVVK